MLQLPALSLAQQGYGTPQGNGLFLGSGDGRNQLQGLREFFPRLRARLPAHRRHIVPTLVDENVYFETNYRPLWTETFDWSASNTASKL